MPSTLHSTLYTLHSTLFILYTLHSTLYTATYTLHSIHTTLLNAVNPTLHTHFTTHSTTPLHPPPPHTPHTLHPHSTTHPTHTQNKRGATVRVPKDSPCPVNVAVLLPELFDKWDSFRNLLLVKTVPMVQMLPRRERQTILRNLQIRDFKDKDFIVRQGEQGEEFYIIQEGSVKVTETRPSPEYGWEKPYEHTLVTLREGHFFGEMALLSNEPRVASVIAAARLTICLCIAKSDFRCPLF
ncbi:cyclic nucleotide-binding-like protein [Ochromonadaceae sp. CCMP2298]|nr:cyclic nucleotide-binding-like protein [Ochromonadaceae sp. CCMP2298]